MFGHKIVSLRVMYSTMRTMARGPVYRHTSQLGEILDVAMYYMYNHVCTANENSQGR